MSVKSSVVSGAKGRGGGRGRGQDRAPAPVRVNRAGSLGDFSSMKKATEMHADMEFIEMCVDLDETLEGKALEYYKICRMDLLITLMVYKGVRVRDIRQHFTDRRGGSDLDWERLGLLNWTHFLIACKKYIDFKLESNGDKEEQLYAFINFQGYKILGRETSDMQKTINCTFDPTSPNLMGLTPIKAEDAYVKGFLDAAEGRPRIDPRVPAQDPGSAADAMRLIRTRKLTYEEQIALANEKIKHPTKPSETLGPVSGAQTPSDFFKFLDKLELKSEPVAEEEEESPFAKPKWKF